MTATEEELRNRIAELERLLGLNECLPLRALLRPTTLWLRGCEQMAGLLLAREFVGRETAFTAIYGARPESDQPRIKIIDILVLRLRQALQPYQITISTADGFYLTADNKKRFRELIARLKKERGG